MPRLVIVLRSLAAIDEAEAVADQQVGLARAATFGNEEQDRTATTATIWKLTCAPTPTVVLQ